MTDQSHTPETTPRPTMREATPQVALAAYRSVLSFVDTYLATLPQGELASNGRSLDTWADVRGHIEAALGIQIRWAQKKTFIDPDTCRCGHHKNYHYPQRDARGVVRHRACRKCNAERRDDACRMFAKEKANGH